jgi:hypothetical protein
VSPEYGSERCHPTEEDVSLSLSVVHFGNQPATKRERCCCISEKRSRLIATHEARRYHQMAEMRSPLTVPAVTKIGGCFLGQEKSPNTVAAAREQRSAVAPRLGSNAADVNFDLVGVNPDSDQLAGEGARGIVDLLQPTLHR